MIKGWLTVSGLLALLFSHGSDASNSSSWANSNAFSGSVGVGYGELETPIALHDKARTNLLPQLSWYGEKFYFENGLLGFALNEHVTSQWDLIAYPNDDGMLYRLNSALAPTLSISPTPFPVYPREITVLEAPERHLSTMAGLRYAQQFEQFDWSAQLGFDVSNVHHGWEFSVRLNLPTIYQHENLTVAMDGGLTIKSAKLVDYYYTPRFGEIAPMEGEIYGSCDMNGTCNFSVNGPYEGYTGYRTHISLKANYELNAQWSLGLLYRHFFLSHAMTESPIVTTTHYAAWFSGLFYRF